ncbi:MAG: hypothetical protein M1818_002926 [Claussenomyces sp. TS43310]|nr:MAG: hypothetical protein M1818_002926 [Claussenomyces sp. TS43310]
MRRRGRGFRKYIGLQNITDVITYKAPGIKSYWFANFLTGDNDHEYCLVTTNANAGNTSRVTSIMLTDITLGTHFGTSIISNGQLSNSEYYADSGVLKTGAYSADQYSEVYVISEHPEATFNLTYAPQGPNLYQGGSGAYIWGLGFAYAYDMTETWVTGTITQNGSVVNIVPETSMTWWDLQWGPSYSPGSWHAYVILLDNGVKIQVTVTNPVTTYRQNSLATFSFPDGHHEVYPVANDVQPANPWVSPVSNITYYHDYRIDISDYETSLAVHVPVEGGETALNTDPSAVNSIADSFAYFSGTSNGLPVRGWGIAERKLSAGCGPFSC